MKFSWLLVQFFGFNESEGQLLKENGPARPSEAQARKELN
jgi:hypothetical protein